MAAFQSTLEEVTFSDFILHLVDVSNPAWEVQMDAVDKTLEKLNASDKPTLIVFTKVDLLTDRTAPRRLVAEWPNSVAISAVTGYGIDGLMEAIIRQVQELLGFMKVLVPYTESSLVQECYDYGRVKNVEYRENGIYLEAELVVEMRHKLKPYAVS